jgi:Zn finger protein HypA/HybF involved in hydrogenase expression
MVGIAEISAGLSSLNVIKGLVQGLDATRKAVITQEIKLELLDKLLEAQQALFAAQQAEADNVARIKGLEAEIARLKDWEGERIYYELTRIQGGAVVYMAKPGKRGTEPPHWYCTNCFGDAKRSILQPQGEAVKGSGEGIWACPVCKTKITTHWRSRPQWPGEAA